LNDLYQLRMRLQTLQSRYTEKHPEIRRLKKAIQDLEKQFGVSGKKSEINPGLPQAHGQATSSTRSSRNSGSS
jgi:capsule polysaccharide export protein KpsE/RkpR